VFGVMPLLNFYVVLHKELSRVALAQKKLPLPLDDGEQQQQQQDAAASNQDTDSTCKSTPSCIGEQTLNEELNECVDPECHVYFLQEVDLSTRTCRRVRVRDAHISRSLCSRY